MSSPQPFRCKEAAALLVFYSCGETTEQETALVETHLAACPLCAAQLAEERGLHESLMRALEASEQNDTGGILLSQCRSELAEALDDLSAPPMQERWQPLGWLRRSMALHPVLNGALLVLVGVALGTQLLPWFSARLNTNSTGHTVNVSPVARFTEDQLSKMAVAGINLVPTSDGVPGTLQVRVRTEEPLVLSGSVDDPDLRRVLTYVVENGDQTDAGVRLDCLEALRARNADLDVRRALLFAARKDQNPAVRMKALESLRDAVADQAVREAQQRIDAALAAQKLVEAVANAERELQDRLAKAGSAEAEAIQERAQERSQDRVSRRRYEDRVPRCARCYRALGLDDSPIMCNRCKREDEERKALKVPKEEEKKT